MVKLLFEFGSATPADAVTDDSSGALTVDSLGLDGSPAPGTDRFQVHGSPPFEAESPSGPEKATKGASF
jgi:hypothetical protein